MKKSFERKPVWISWIPFGLALSSALPPKVIVFEGETGPTMERPIGLNYQLCPLPFDSVLDAAASSVFRRSDMKYGQSEDIVLIPCHYPVAIMLLDGSEAPPEVKKWWQTDGPGISPSQFLMLWRLFTHDLIERHGPGAFLTAVLIQANGEASVKFRLAVEPPTETRRRDAFNWN